VAHAEQVSEWVDLTVKGVAARESMMLQLILSGRLA